MKAAICLTAALLLAGCAEHPADSSALAGKWKVEKVDGAPLGGGAELSFDTERNVLSSYAGCNRMNTRYTSTGVGRLNFGYTASTRMACGEEQAEAESRISRAFTRIESFRIGRRSLLLEDGRGTVLLQAARADSESLEAVKQPSENGRSRPTQADKSSVHIRH